MFFNEFISLILKIIASSLLKPYFSALALNSVSGSIIGCKDKTSVFQCIPITFLCDYCLNFEYK